jgi:hypothetical protein
MQRTMNKIKPDRQDFEAIERKAADEYRLAQAAKLIRLYEQGRLPFDRMREMDRIAGRSRTPKEPPTSHRYQRRQSMATSQKATKQQQPKLKVPRGAILRAINAGHISTKEAHERGYMGTAELRKRFKSYR